MNPENEAKLIRPRPRLGGLAVACSLLADPGRRPCAIFLTSHSSATRHQWLNLFSTRHECFTSDVGLTRTRLVSCILLTSLESTLRDAQLQKAEGARIRARVKHAIEGGRNTAFFFRQEKQHAQAKSVSQVRTKDGSIQSSEEKPVLECMAKFYESLFKSEQLSIQDQSEWLKSLATPARPEELSNLEGGLSIEKLHKAVTSMQGGKFPGLDGLPKEFYVAFWQLVGEDLNQVLQGSIEQGELPLSMRRAVISPIFKKGAKTLLDNWKPISLLNTDYKILTKALTNHLKGVIISLVESDQTGVIPGRLIQTNISTVRDLIDHTEETTGRSGALIFLDW